MIQAWRLEIDKTLSNLLHQVPVAEAARYSVLNGGKRLRPLFALATADALKAPLSQAIVPACALELIHTYSMIHDDLPAMDNDDLRRGKPTLHKVYTEGQAILAGDFLLTYAFEVLSNAPDLSAETKLSLIELVSKKAGASGMIGGQWTDLESEHKLLNLNETNVLHEMKTGALIEASILTGALIGKAKPEMLNTLSQFALKVGLAFQIIDDVLDHTHPEVKHGTRSDVTNKKSTYVSLLGIEKAQAKAIELYESASAMLDNNFNLLKELARISVFRTK